MRNYLLVFFFLITTCHSSFSQRYKHFEGNIYYDIYLVNKHDHSSKKVNYLTIRIKDSLVRVDTDSKLFGGQTTIHNLTRHRSYILLKSKDTFYAIQHFDTAAVEKAILFKKVKGKTKLGDFKIKKVSRLIDTNKIDTIEYFTQLDPKYLAIYPGLKGLPATYHVEVNKDFYFLYKAIKVEPKALDDKLFMIPKLFKIVTFDEFIKSQE